MRIRTSFIPLTAVLLNLTTSFLVQAAPYVPADGNQVIERLPDRNDPRQRQMAALRKHLAAAPNDLGTAAQLARRYIEASRSEGDPRYLGYAQAALAPWWRSATPPAEARLLRATLLQSQHQFTAALADLDAVLREDRTNAQALLTRATILQVQGRFNAAKSDCLRLYAIAPELVAVACAASVAGLTGQAQKSHALLETALRRDPAADAGLRVWVGTLLADMARRMDDPVTAERHLQEAFATSAGDSYLLGAYADFLLEQHRAAEVIPLLKDHLRVDALLLRHAEALKAQGSREADAHIAMVRDRFRAAELRGDTVHLREQARFALHLQNDAQSALRIAQRNWAIQKEPADAHILLEAAIAAHDVVTGRQTVAWVRGTGMQDPILDTLAAKAGDMS